MHASPCGPLPRKLKVFIDNPAVPTQLETVLDLLYELRQKAATSETVKAILQPKGLPDLNTNNKQTTYHLHAARELQLVTQDPDGNLRLAYSIREGKPTAKEAIVQAVDRHVLSSVNVEPWFGRLYGYVIAREEVIPGDTNARKNLCTEFNNALPSSIERNNPLNSDKLSPHYLRWYAYAGMGWRDPADRFILDPTERLRRALPSVFNGDQRLEAAAFMSSLAQVCPELDGGAMFKDVCTERYNPADRVCTSALAMALRNLHDEGCIQLDCPQDSQGWSLERGGSVRNNESLQSDRFDRVTLRLSKKRT